MRTPDQYSLIVARGTVFEAGSDWAALLGESGRPELLYNVLRLTNHRYARVQSAHSR